jgi:hypothetical protein
LALDRRAPTLAEASSALKTDSARIHFGNQGGASRLFAISTGTDAL